MKKYFPLALVLCVLAGCASSTRPPGGYGICAEQPGSMACQIDQYQRAA